MVVTLQMIFVISFRMNFELVFVGGMEESFIPLDIFPYFCKSS